VRGDGLGLLGGHGAVHLCGGVCDAVGLLLLRLLLKSSGKALRGKTEAVMLDLVLLLLSLHERSGHHLLLLGVATMQAEMLLG
jgi:hypothetical protein